MKTLVLGGNHYFGKKLVKLLLDNSHDVTLLNRGNHDDGFGNRVQRIICDRHDKAALNDAIVTDYDIIFDQSCFDYDQAKIACEVFNGKVKKYIFTSSISAYNEYGTSIKENQFDPHSFTFTKKETMESNYGEAKRQAEVSFYKYAKFPVTAVRFPIVLDENDETKRLQFHVHKIKNNKPIHLINPKALIGFISADDAAFALFELSKLSYCAPINVASSKPISLKKLLDTIEDIVGCEAIIVTERDEENLSPYNIAQDWYTDCSKLEQLGIKLDSVTNYLPRMISSINDKQGLY
jgi:nucleoside-diphosphate-sugar epimerase